MRMRKEAYGLDNIESICFFPDVMTMSTLADWLANMVPDCCKDDRAIEATPENLARQFACRFHWKSSPMASGLI